MSKLESPEKSFGKPWRWPLPKVFYEKPIVLLDSGQSVGESIFIERWRYYLWHTLERTAIAFKVPTVWIMYPNTTQWARHGSYPVNEYDEWEIRPVRRNDKLEAGGFLATVSKFEDGCHHLGIKAPWREWNSKNRRAVAVYLNPNSKDLEWGKSYYNKFKRPYNLPEFHIGAPKNRILPKNFLSWVDDVWCYDTRAKERLNAAIKPYFGKSIPWFNWWKEDRKSTPQYDFGIAGSWRDSQVNRSMSIAKEWCPDWGKVKEPRVDKEATWKELLDTTSCRWYMVATTRESIPFDAMIAVARGATLVAPDVPVFSQLPGKKMLYPAKMNGDSILWSKTEVKAWLQNRLRKYVRNKHSN
jgi:hypothetical protein